MSNLWDDQCSSRRFLNQSRVGASITWAGRVPVNHPDSPVVSSCSASGLCSWFSNFNGVACCTCRGSSLEEIVFVRVHETVHKYVDHDDITSASPVEHGRES